MITIAIPFFNAEKFLELAIKSVLNQTYSNWILLLIDDGSTDSSLQIAKQYELNDFRIKVISDGLNKNIGFRLNEITNYVDTKYLARMDADDIMHPMRIEIQLKLMENNPEIDVLGSNAYSIDENNRIKGVRFNIGIDNPKLIDCKTFIHPTIIAKSEWFKKNPYDVKAVRVEDAELWFRSRKSIFKTYTKPLLYYREFGSKYYKKYFKGIKSMFYVARKHKSLYWYYLAISNIFKGIIYWIAYLFEKENVLIERRIYLLSRIEKYQEDLNRIIIVNQ